LVERGGKSCFWGKKPEREEQKSSLVAHGEEAAIYQSSAGHGHTPSKDQWAGLVSGCREWKKLKILVILGPEDGLVGAGQAGSSGCLGELRSFI